MTDEDFLHIVQATPLVSIDLVLRDETGRALLGKRLNRPAQHSWFVPGGRIRKNERVQEALKRIAQRELGVTIAKARLIGVFDHIYPDNFLGVADVNTHYVVIGFAAALSNRTAFTPDEQHAALEWWSVEDLLRSPEVHENTKAYFRVSPQPD